MRKIMVIGATSAIAHATMKIFASDGDSLFLVARDTKKLDAVADDLKVRGACKVEVCVMDMLMYDQHLNIIKQAETRLSGLDMVLIAHGTLPDQKACEESFDLARKEFEVNCISTISMLTHLANYFEQKKSGTIAVISSVAGDRGRQSNYIYGTAKGAVSIFMQGLRNRLCKSGVRVLTIKPGFVDTPMTAKFQKGLLWAKPDRIAKEIYRVINKQHEIAYIPKFWRYIMVIIRLIPEGIFKKLNL